MEEQAAQVERPWCCHILTQAGEAKAVSGGTWELTVQPGSALGATAAIVSARL